MGGVYGGCYGAGESRPFACLLRGESGVRKATPMTPCFSLFQLISGYFSLIQHIAKIMNRDEAANVTEPCRVVTAFVTGLRLVKSFTINICDGVTAKKPPGWVEGTPRHAITISAQSGELG